MSFYSVFSYLPEASLFCQFPTVEHEVGNVNEYEVWYVIANFRLYKLLMEALSNK